MIRKGIHEAAIVDVVGQAEIPADAILEPGSVVYVGEAGQLTLGPRNIIYPNATVRIDKGWMRTGADVSFGPGCQIYEPRAGLTIGDHCLIAGGVLICGVNHGLARLDTPMRFQPAEAHPIVIGHDVWIGMGAIITPGVTIGDGAVIGSGSVVTRDVPARAIAFGNPCRVRRQRMPDPLDALTREMGELRLHLGCGSRFIPGFLHVDAQAAPHVDVVTDLADLGFLPDRSVALIYASHVLEHFGRWQFRSLLMEWLRVLRPGGMLRLAVPDFAACVRLYHEQGMADGLTGLIGLICGGQRNDFDFHKMIFDEAFLTRELLMLGYRNVRRWDWRTTEHSHIDDYSQAHIPHMDKDNGTLVSLNLEAER